ncbi:MAG: NADH-quinone oxidoreductase subunit F, partial [Aquificae bacterium]|nr:NADH-quinone oxidoreductase subunit F [Aquificota bacterium]
PCRVGTYEQHVILKKLKEGTATEKDIEYLKHLAQNIPANSICGLGYSAPNAVADALRKFPEEIEAHLNKTCKKCFG